MCVLMIHCIGDTDYVLNKFILSFDMQLFFFLSGLCSKKSTKSFFYFIFSKVKTLLIPQVTMSIVYAAYIGVVNILTSTGLLKLHSFGGGGQLFLSIFTKWFLIVLFFISIIYYWIEKIPCKYYLFIIIADVAAIVIVQLLKIETVIHLEIIPMALLFYLIGHMLKNIIDNEEIKKKEKGVWVMALPAIAIASYHNIPIEMHKNQYGNAFLFIITSILGIWFICRISQGLQDNIILNWFGRNSIIVYTLHWVLFSAFGGILKRLPHIKNIGTPYPMCLYNFVLCFTVLIPIIYICNKWFWFFFGLKPIRKDDSK